MAGCVTGDAVYIGNLGGLKKFFEQGIDGILSDIASAILGAAVDLFSDVGDINTIGPKETNEAIHLQTNWLVVTIAVASLLVASFRMAMERKGQAGTEALKGLVRMVLTVGAAWFVLTNLAKLADDYSAHLYDQGIKEQMKLIANCGTDGLTAFLLIVVGLLLLLAGVVHVILMYIRLGAMTLLTGTLPLAAAASMTEAGGGWWKKHIAWMIAWLAYKPTVGLIMYGGAAMIGSAGDNAKHYKLAGAGILLLAAVALPALMRLVVPAMAALGSKDSTQAGVAAGGAAVAGIASGAKRIAGGSDEKSRGRSRSGGGGPSGSGGSGGASAAIGKAATVTKAATKVTAGVVKHAGSSAGSGLPD